MQREHSCDTAKQEISTMAASFLIMFMKNVKFRSNYLIYILVLFYYRAIFWTLANTLNRMIPYTVFETSRKLCQGQVDLNTHCVVPVHV